MEQISPKLKPKNKNLLITKIDINKRNHSVIKKLIDEYFTSSTTYFSPSIEGNKIIVGKRLSKEEESSLSERIDIDSVKKLSMLGKNSVFLKPNRNRKNALSTCGSPMNRSVSSSKLGLSPSTLGSKFIQLFNDSKSQISDTEITSIFEKFKRIKQNNSKYANEFVKNENNVNIRKMLNLQETILKNQELHEKENQKMENLLSKKVKKHPNLLYKSIKNYRILKEFREKDQDQTNNIGMSYVNWLMQLRLHENVPGTKTCMFNSGTLSKPNWSTLYLKFPIIKEKIREGFKEYCSDNEGKQLEKSVFSYYKIAQNQQEKNKAKKYIESLNGLNVVGKSLLQAEIENFKTIKGRKKLLNFPVPENEKKEKEYQKSSSMKNIYQANIIRSCMNLHEI